MATVTVPSVLENNFLLRSGDNGSSIQKAFEFNANITNVENLFTWDSTTGSFSFSFQERGVAYGDTDASQCLVELSFFCKNHPGLTFHFVPVQKNQWGLNYAATVRVTHDDGSEYDIFIPGTRTYDPAGKTGDPHASERIGPSCSRTQAAITFAQLMAALHGADQSSLDELQEKLRPLINKYHGRETLFDWMFLQIKETVYLRKDVTPYPEFIKSCIASKKLILDNSRDHTRSYLYSYNLGNPSLPELYYKKVSQKDRIEDLFSTDDLATFKKLANI